MRAAVRTSKTQRDRLGAATAGALGLAGIILLLQARPVATLFSLPYRSGGQGAAEIGPEPREASPTGPALAPTPVSVRIPRHAPGLEPRPAMARPPAWIEPPSPPAPAASPEDVAPPSPPPRVLATILRASGLACLGGREALLSAAERELCREKLGAQAWSASSVPAIDPEERAAYDALARAQAPRRALVPLTARGAGGSLTGDDRLRGGRKPRVGCALRFGPNADQASNGPTGPCFLRATAGAPSDGDTRASY